MFALGQFHIQHFSVYIRIRVNTSIKLISEYCMPLCHCTSLVYLKPIKPRIPSFLMKVFVSWFRNSFAHCDTAEKETGRTSVDTADFCILQLNCKYRIFSLVAVVCIIASVIPVSK